MLFPTYQFLIFFILVFCSAILLKNKVFPYKLLLLVVSLIFYAFWNSWFLALLVTDILINYSLLKLLFVKQTHRKLILTLTIILNFGYLGVFKYFNFFADSLFAFLNYLNLQTSFPIIQIIAPVGISFYTFRIIAQFLDCYHYKILCPNLIDYSVYISYFPQIASGPIARPLEFYRELNIPQKYNYDISEVIALILSGLFKKYTISSFLFNFTQLPFRTPQQYSSLDLILASFAYAGLIYTDFSGYSDLSNGISCLLGFKPIPNFNMPYQSRSLQEFWRRWHISLSQWLRDYLYIPLGGNRKGKTRQLFNLFLTMLIGGFWHGAGWTFIIWGSLHGIGLIVNHLWKETAKKLPLKSAFFAKIVPLTYWLITFLFITFTWIFFNAVSLEAAGQFITGIFISPIKTIQFNYWQLYACLALILALNFYGDKFSQLFKQTLNHSHIILQIAIISLCTYTILKLGPSTVPPFIYFNF